MELNYIDDHKTFKFDENEHTVFELKKHLEDKLLTISLCNSYGSDCYQFYQIKKWYSKLKADWNYDFIVYEGEHKMGKLVRSHGCYFLYIYGVKYSLYAGVHEMKRKMLCFDRDLEIASFDFDENTLNFTHNYQGALMASMFYIFKEIVNQKHFSQDIFIRRYNKVYKRDVFTQAKT